MQLDDRNLSSSTYRFGFNGKENDPEVAGQQDYGFRIYDRNLARFKSVDPLTKSYPWYTPFQFAGNSPIKFIDLDGLEPENNPKDYNGKQGAGVEVISRILSLSAQYESRENKNTPLNKKTLQGSAELTGNNEYITDTNKESSNLFNLKINNSTTFKVDESNAKDFKNYEAFVVKELLNNFVSGYGAENYEFPMNGIISSKFKHSDVLKAALNEYFTGKTVINKQYSFGTIDLVSDTWRNGTIFNITGMVGSAQITITDQPNSNDIIIKIFNITSMTSGTFGKEIFFWDKEKYYPKSYVRNNENAVPVPYGNISQTFSLQMSKSEAEKLKGN